MLCGASPAEDGDAYAADKELRSVSRLSRPLRWAFALSVALFFFVAVAPRNTLSALLQPPASHAVVIDAGSSGTRVHVFRRVCAAWLPRASHAPRLTRASRLGQVHPSHWAPASPAAPSRAAEAHARPVFFRGRA